MTPEEYRLLLDELPIENPTASDTARVFPHLTKEQIAEVLTADVDVACPPLRIRGAYYVITYLKEWKGLAVESIGSTKTEEIVRVFTQHRPARLSGYRTSRTRASYTNGKFFRDSRSTDKYIGEAMSFAEANWGDKLICDDWISTVSLEIQDSPCPANDRRHLDYPRKKNTLFITLNRELTEIINDHSKPGSELLDDAVAQMTLDEVISSELNGGRYVGNWYNCAYCGGGLSINGCTSCSFRFKDNDRQGGWSTPLSPKMVEFLRASGHEFAIDPEIAWDNERDAFFLRRVRRQSK